MFPISEHQCRERLRLLKHTPLALLLVLPVGLILPMAQLCEWISIMMGHHSFTSLWLHE
jgi:hypothetical protein